MSNADLSPYQLCFDNDYNSCNNMNHVITQGINIRVQLTATKIEVEMEYLVKFLAEGSAKE